MQLLLSGNPSRTPLLVAAPRGLDLALKAHAWENASGDVWLSALAGELAGAAGLLARAAKP